MSTVRCPSNCDCVWPFLHSYVTVERTTILDGFKTGARTTFVICTECNHWIGGNRGCLCLGKCHSFGSVGMDIVTIDYGKVDCS